MILFNFSNKTSYRLLRRVARKSLSAGYSVAFFYSGEDRDFHSSIQKDAVELGAECFSVDESFVGREKVAFRLRRNFRQLLLHFVLMLGGFGASNTRTVVARRACAYADLLLSANISSVICSEDGISGDMVLISAARSLGIRVIDVPYGNGTSLELEIDLARKAEEGRLILATGIEWIAMRLFAPQWLKKQRFADAVMFEVPFILSYESTGVSIRDSWIIHGGLSDILCVESLSSKRQYVREGIPEKKMVLTGSPYCDLMYDAINKNPHARDAFRKPKKIEAKKTRILVSWPPSYHDTYPGKNEFETYESMTRATVAFLQSLTSVDLTVSLHPACDDYVSEVMRELAVEVTDEYVIDLIPLNDIFVTCFSSTIRWAIAAGKVVVNYDAYGLELPIYSGLSGVTSHKRFDDFERQLVALTSSEESLTIAMRAQIEAAEDWGVVDGKATERILEHATRSC